MADKTMRIKKLPPLFITKFAHANSSAVRFWTLPIRLRNLIPSAAADFASACTYLYIQKLFCVYLCFSKKKKIITKFSLNHSSVYYLNTDILVQ